MDSAATTRASYLVRVWWEPRPQGQVWRASVTDLATGERKYFATPERLARHLEKRSVMDGM
jgi:hypothetical protein